MAEELTNRYYIDSLDLWTTFNISFESGSDEFLKIPEAKEKTTRNWLDEDGVQVDLSRTFFKSREVHIRCFSITPDKTTFTANYDNLILLLRSPGSRRLTITKHNKDYNVYYQDNKFYQSFNYRTVQSGNVLAKFVLTLVEAKPSISGSNGYVLPPFIVDHNNKFLIS